MSRDETTAVVPDGRPSRRVTRLSRQEEEEEEERSSPDVLAFSVERILAQDFGAAAPCGEGRRPSSPEPSGRATTTVPVWIHCSRFSARPTAGPRRRGAGPAPREERRGRTAFADHQVARLRDEFGRAEYLSELGRRGLARELGLTEAQVKIWFQNARAKRRRSDGRQSPLAERLAEAGLYNHSAAASTTGTGYEYEYE